MQAMTCNRDHRTNLAARRSQDPVGKHARGIKRKENERKREETHTANGISLSGAGVNSAVANGRVIIETVNLAIRPLRCISEQKRACKLFFRSDPDSRLGPAVFIGGIWPFRSDRIRADAARKETRLG